MEPITIITMVVILTFVWGGFAVLIVTAFRKEARKVREAEEAAHDRAS